RSLSPKTYPVVSSGAGRLRPRGEPTAERVVVLDAADHLVGDPADLAARVRGSVRVTSAVADLREDLERRPAREALAEAARALERLRDEPFGVVELARSGPRSGELTERQQRLGASLGGDRDPRRDLLDRERERLVRERERSLAVAGPRH